MVMECPEGKLVPPDNVFPMITKLLLSNTEAGLGTANISFSTLENIADTSEADIKDSQSLGAYTIKIANKDKEISASPNWVRLYSVVGNCDNLAFKKKKSFFWICMYLSTLKAWWKYRNKTIANKQHRGKINKAGLSLE